MEIYFKCQKFFMQKKTSNKVRIVVKKTIVLSSLLDTKWLRYIYLLCLSSMYKFNKSRLSTYYTFSKESEIIRDCRHLNGGLNFILNVIQ